MHKIVQFLRKAQENGLDTNRIARMLTNIGSHYPDRNLRENAQIEYLQGLDYMQRPICG